MFFIFSFSLVRRNAEKRVKEETGRVGVRRGMIGYLFSCTLSYLIHDFVLFSLEVYGVLLCFIVVD